MTPSVIHFYRIDDDHGCLSNFAPYPVRLKGKVWPTAEHYFQAQKFAGTIRETAIQKANSPMTAARMGRDRRHRLRPDWESVKVSIMREVVRAKFAQNVELREILMATGGAKLVEHTSRDDFWGDGADGRGRNMLGRILVEVRSELRETEEGSRASS